MPAYESISVPSPRRNHAYLSSSGPPNSGEDRSSDAKTLEIDGIEDDDVLDKYHKTPVLDPWVLLRISVYLALWYLFSLLLSLYNKFLVGSKHGNFPAPLLMTSFHFLLQWAISAALLHGLCPSWAPADGISWGDYLCKVVPTALATAADIGTSNLSLAFITLTFYTMCKSSAPVFLLTFAFAFRVETPSLRLLGIILIISMGVLLTVAGETDFDLLGFLLVMVASATSGLRWVLVQVLLQKESLGLTNPLVTLYYLTPVMSASMALFSLIHEPWSLLARSPYFDSYWHTLGSVGIMTAGGCLAFCMIMTEFLFILETSAVSMSVAGIVKEAVTVLVSHLVFHDRLTSVNLEGFVVIFIGVSLFNVYKFYHMRDSHSAASDLAAGEKGGGDGVSCSSLEERGGKQEDEEKQALVPRQHEGSEGGNMLMTGAASPLSSPPAPPRAPSGDDRP